MYILEMIKKYFKRNQDKKATSYLMQKLSHWATILGFFTSTFFAAYAIYLTIKVEKTDRKVELLESLAFKTDTTNENILMLINEVKNSQEQADTIIKELIKQNITQNSQLITINKSSHFLLFNADSDSTL